MTEPGAVMGFREAAERQILNFDRALAGWPLEAHRLDSAVALVQRLKAGLGSSLNGLSEDARITALEWSVSIETGGDAGRHARVYYMRPYCGRRRKRAKIMQAEPDPETRTRPAPR